MIAGTPVLGATVLADAEDQLGSRSGSFWSVHAGHFALLAAWVLVVLVVGLVNNRRHRAAPDRPAPELPRSGWLLGAATASVASAGIHVSVIGEHFRESALYGTFFLVLSVAQLGWAAWLVLKPSRSWLFAGGAASVLVALLWLATRTIGIPVGPAAGEREAFGSLDLLASAAELLVAACVAGALGLRRAHGVRPEPVTDR